MIIKGSEKTYLMKNTTRIILLIMLLVLVMSVAASCGKPDSIALTESNNLQLTYVRGQELNLSDCTITVVNGKKTSEIPLTSDDVTVSGYDKDTLGEQTVTVTYKKNTTEFTVTVVERVVISDAVSDYLIGDAIDLSKGKVTVTDYNGVSSSVALSNENVTVSGFDSSVAKGGADVKVTYIDGSQSYEGSFKVNIHAIESVEFRKPNKITYSSHYTGKPDLAGGYFTVTGNNGALAKMIPITDGMVSGFDVSAVTPANSPLTQSVTVTFNNKNYNYDVKITYSDVSMFRDNAQRLNVINWNGENLPEIPTELGDLSLSLMTAYVEMSSSERALIDEALSYSVARAAMLYGFEIWHKNILEFDGAFAIENGSLILELESPAKVAAAVELFKKEDSAIYTLAPTLIDIAQIFGDKVVYENATKRYTFSAFPVMSAEYITLLNGVCNHVTSLFDTISVVPDEWTVASLNDHHEQLNAVVYNMLNAGYYLNFPSMYDIVSAWRTNDDLFDILYNYLFATDKKTIIPNLYPVGLPDEIETIHYHLSSALSYMNSVLDAEIYDATNVFYHYKRAIELVKVLKTKTGSMELYVYENADFNKILGITSAQAISFDQMIEYIRTARGGMISLKPLWY